ncbi:MAG: potassium transporter TrkG [Acidimicrobiales bacterium]
MLAFAVANLAGAVLLALPWSSGTGESVGPVTALFTATSALCVTGLAVVDTGTAWSGFGQVVILGLVQLGGLGITTLAALLAVVVSRRLGLRSRLLAQTETGALDLGSVRLLVRRIVAFSLAFEAVGAVLLTALFWAVHHQDLASAAWNGVFHAVSAFNNAGFSPFADNLVSFNADPPLLLVVSVLVIAGGIGFPVLSELFGPDWRRPRRWTLHTRMTVATTLALLVSGTVVFLALEWSNSATLGPMSVLDKLTNAWFGSVTPRTAGFNTVDYSQVRSPTLLLTMGLMLIGGGSVSAAGGLKVTTFALLGFVIWSELRGERDVDAFGRRIPSGAQRQALSIALLYVGAAVAATFVLGVFDSHDLGTTAFEAVSALGTVGLSTGVTGSYSDPGQLVLTGLMFIGRVGPATVGAALVLRSRDRLYRNPEGRPLVG